MAAAISHADNHRIAGFKSATLGGADFLDRAGNLMADQHGHPARDSAFDDFIVGVAHTACLDLDQHFIGGDGRHLEIFDRQRLVNAIENCGFHDFDLPVRRLIAWQRYIMSTGRAVCRRRNLQTDARFEALGCYSPTRS